MPRALFPWDEKDPVEKALAEVREDWAGFAANLVREAGRPEAGGRVVFQHEPMDPVEQYRVVYEIAHPGEQAFVAESFIVRDHKGDTTGESEFLARKVRATLPKAKRAILQWGI